MLVEDLMSTDIVTVDRGATLERAVERLLAEDVGSVVVLADGNPAGIVTESDVLRAALETGEPLGELSVDDVAHDLHLTTSPDETVQRVARRMAAAGVKKVPVVEDLDLVGIVTLTDVVWRLSDIRREASTLEAARDRWESREGR